MIIGHNKQRQLLKKAFQGVNIPQALIFSGMDYLGKKKIALDVIKSMNCVEDEPCNT
ncbi:MAG: DNA polymerase III subunit gamma/tau, partial [Parcubacteria group bacterium]|nr:DNA polymerase III subunit gamma/tau [Parcubacteria group bacterium]